jgi:hypothetical protein
MKTPSGQLRLPNGDIANLTVPPTADHRFFVAKFPIGQPDQAVIVSPVGSKEDLFREFFHYYVAKPSPLKRCASCHRQLSTDSYCIQTELLCIFMTECGFERLTCKGTSVRVKLGYCLNNFCLPIWLQTPKSSSIQ